MKAQITPTSIKRDGENTISYSNGDIWIDLISCEIFKQGTVLAIRDSETKTIYVTDLAYTSVAAILAAAPGTGGFFVLT